MTSITIFVGNAPYSAERPYTALRFAYSALIAGHSVKMFFFEDGIFTLKKDQNPAKIYNVQEWVNQCLEEDNFEVAVCGVCMKARGMNKEELIKGIKLGTMEAAVQMTVESEKQLFF